MSPSPRTSTRFFAPHPLECCSHEQFVSVQLLRLSLRTVHAPLFGNLTSSINLCDIIHCLHRARLVSRLLFPNGREPAGRMSRSWSVGDRGGPRSRHPGVFGRCAAAACRSTCSSRSWPGRYMWRTPKRIRSVRLWERGAAAGAAGSLQVRPFSLPACSAAATARSSARATMRRLSSPPLLNFG